MIGKTLTAGIAIAMAALAVPAYANVVTFDDLPGDGVVPDGYGGIIWNGQWNYYLDSQPPYTPQSTPTRVYDFVTNGTFDFSSPVVFNGAYFSGYDYAPVQFQLYLGGSLVATSGSLAPNATPTFLSSGYSGWVDEVQVVSPSPDYFVMDDVTYNQGAVPEPVSWAMFIGGLGCVGGSMRYRRKRSVSFA